MSKWVTSWGVPTSYVAEGICNVIGDTTLSYVFYNGIKGAKVRIRFSNAYGEEDVKIDKVSFSEWSGKGLNAAPGTLTEVTMKESGNIIKAGGELTTDAVEFNLESGRSYMIRLYIKEPTQIVTGYNKFAEDKAAPCWFTRGDKAYEETIGGYVSKATVSYLFLCGVDVLSADDTNAIMAFGDSITARPWPDLLMRRINGEGITNRSVVRKAIGGNRVLRDYRDYLPRRSMGLSAVERFEMSIKQVLGVDKVIMLEGINDIYHPMPNSLFNTIDELPTAEELIDGYRKCRDIAHKYGAKFYLCTILPTKHLTLQGFGKEELRNKVNNWIRTTDEIDGYIEFDKNVADKSDPSVMAQEYDCGDTLHPNLEGSTVLCNSVPEHIFR